jgi:pimeloyl-ACP methyl ester carboxylesterase
VSSSGLFIPGWGAQAGYYRRAMPPGWEVAQPPSFGASRGSTDIYREWLRTEWRAHGEPPALAGHSYGAALAVAGTAAGEVEPERLVLVNPAGLPLTKSFVRCAVDFSRRFWWFPLGDLARSARHLVAHPVDAVRLARAVYALDLREQLEELKRRGIRCTVVATRSDTLSPPQLGRRVAEYAGGEYRELDAPGGHLWFLRAPDLLRQQLA